MDKPLQMSGSSAMKIMRARVGRKPSRKPFRMGLKSTTLLIQPRPGCDDSELRVVREATNVTGMAQKMISMKVINTAATWRMLRWK